MSFPGPDRYKLGGLAGAVVGAIGGIFAFGLVPAIIYRNAGLLFNTPKFSVICWIISLVLGWKLGALLGTRCGTKYGTTRAEVVGGAAAGVFVVLLIVLLGYLMWLQAPPD